MNCGRKLFFGQLLALLALLSAPLPSVASAMNGGSPGALFEQANKVYSQANYAKAAVLYEEILTSHGLSAPIFYNLGNSYAQSSQPGKAILSYLRALRLSPNNSDIKGNLQLLRKEQGLFLPDKTMIQRVAHLLEMDQWCLTAAISLGLLTILHSLSFFIPVSKRAQLGLSSLLITTTLIFCFFTHQRYLDYHDGVISTEGVHLRISPFEASSFTGKLQEGLVIRPIKSHGEYYLVEDRSGRSGWLHKDDFQLIVN